LQTTAPCMGVGHGHHLKRAAFGNIQGCHVKVRAAKPPDLGGRACTLGDFENRGQSERRRSVKLFVSNRNGR